ncbi:GTP-binding protein [Amycolatopsis pithecellobii]|uniref:ATP-binding protein n=1 Tax=Amycolatopsis pithecellobii TaxID=664692 RepID=A0A6N7YS01_9PSEU|nr:ATP/GTP-binding protein [Amycolatopsis pithecellobii]MTD55805.1 ATP-binding protein [Amycolatopsis pithecellobii]
MTTDSARPSTVARRKSVTSVKIVVAGAFGVGKTTFVGAVSDIHPVRTEAIMTAASNSYDSLDRVPLKSTTTVAMDFGRVELEDDLLLYLFGTPGQERFWFMWDNLVRGALGAVILADTRRLSDTFTSIDFFENRGIPYVVAINLFDGILHHRVESVRKALSIDESVPVLTCDARERGPVKQTLLRLLEHVMAQVQAEDAKTS